MAGYGKEQPQPQFNAAYYGPSIPPQPGYYGPPPAAPRRSGPACLLCFLFKIAAVVVIALGALSVVLWLIYRPHTVRAYADSAALSRFDLGAGGGAAGGNLLQYNLTVDIRLRNPNRFGIRYDYAEAQASYDGDRFGFHPVPPFYLDSKSDGRITAAFSGSSVMTDDDVLRTHRRETRDGFYYVKVRVYADLSFKVRAFRVHDYKSKITCMLRLPAPAGGSTASAAMTPLSTRCDVDF
ncbi:hypothetical protein ACP4OV_030079 [Aristida adscensionis]